MNTRALGLLAAITSTIPASVGAQTVHPNPTSSLGTNTHLFRNWTSELPFLDVFKHSRAWLPQCQPGQTAPADCTFANAFDTGESALLDLDDRGWPRTLPAPADAPIYWFVATTMLDDLDGHYPAGQYTVLYDGEGTITYGIAATKNDALSAPGRDIIDVNPALGGIELEIRATDPNGTGNYIRNIRVIMPGYESSYASQVFYPVFLEKTQPYGIIRFQQWTATNNSALVNWEDRPLPEDARYTIQRHGVPYEVAIDLANRLGQHLWLNVPHMATDTFIAEMAALVRDRLSPSQLYYVEFSNEIWNDFSGFPQGAWLEQQAVALWPEAVESPYAKRAQYHGMRTAQMCDITRAVFASAGQGDRVRCILGAHDANAWFGEQAMDCPLWTEGAPCSAHGLYALSTAPYLAFRMGDPMIRDQIMTLAQAPDGVDRVFDEIFEGGVLIGNWPGGELDRLIAGIQENYDAAQLRGLELTAYEAGTNMFDPLADPTIQALFWAVDRDPRIAQVISQSIDAWRTIGGREYVHYTNIAKYDLNGSCGALEFTDQEHAPKYDALMTYIEEVPCWWGCKCGDGILDPGESCDDGNRLDGDCCDSICRLDPPTVECRTSRGSCDPAEHCTGTSAGCPADVHAVGVCRPVANACDVAAEACDGVIDACPADTPRDCSGLATACLAASCDDVLGCVTTVINENGPCNDNNPATAVDVCQSGACVAGTPLPVLTNLFPFTAAANSAGGNLNLFGTGFVPSSQVTWAGTNLTTTYVSPTQLTARATATEMAGGGVFEVRVTNPLPGGGTSAARTFTVNNPLPSITTMTPTSMPAATGGQLTLTGTGFTSNSEVRLSSTPLAITSRTTTQLVATIPVDQQGGWFSITVVNPAPSGGTSAVMTLMLTNPAPQLTSLSPPSAVAGSAATVVTLNGTGFVRSSAVTFDGAALAATYLSPTQLRITVPSASLAATGSFNVVVTNPAPAGGVSGAVPLNVVDASASLTAVTPAGVLLGSGDTVLTLSGASFQANAVATFAGTPLATTWVSASELVATVPAALLTSAGAFDVAVVNGAVTGNAVPFQVQNPLPLATALSPAAVVAGSSEATVSVLGADFVFGCTATMDGIPVAATFVSSTEVRVTLPGDLLGTLGYFLVAVTNPGPGGGSSAPLEVTVGNPVPVISSITPTSAGRGSAGGLLTVNGTSFLTSSVVLFDGAPLVTTYVSSTRLTALLTAANLATSGTRAITVSTPAPGGGPSNAATFVVALNPLPQVTSLSPSSALVGSPALSLTVDGASFVNGSAVAFANLIRPTTFVSEAQLVATIPATALTTPGTYNVVAWNPAPGGGASTTLTFTVNNPGPTLSAVAPPFALAGLGDTTVTLTGAGFQSGAVASFDGTALATTFVSSTELTATIPAALLASGGPRAITVSNPPPSAPSGAITFSVDDPSVLLTAITPAAVAVGSADTLVTLTGDAFLPGATVSAGALVLSPTFVSSTELQVTLPAASLATASTVELRVHNPNGRSSGAAVLSVENPAPILTSMTPTYAATGSMGGTMTVTGSGFVPGTFVTFGGTALATTYTSPTQLSATLGAAQLAVAGSYELRVVTAGPGGGTSGPRTFTVGANPRAVLASISPASATAGSGALLITATGTFVTGASINFNGAFLPTTFISATEVRATIPTASLVTAGTRTVSVSNPAPGGGASVALTFTVSAP